MRILDEIQAALDAATPRPWVINDEGYATDPRGGIAVDYSISYPDENTREDLAAIVAAVNNAEALVAVARAAAACGLVDHHMDTCISVMTDGFDCNCGADELRRALAALEKAGS